MSRTPRFDFPGCIQHVMCRGLEKGLIYRDDEDRECFRRITRKVLSETATRCLAWSLMPNHNHMMAESGSTPLSVVMHRINTTYAGAFNRRHGRVGPLFQGRFLSKPIDSEAYLDEAIRYIHLNPLRARIVPDLDALASYPWTGHAALMSGVPDGIIDIDAVTGLFRDAELSPRVVMIEYMLERVDATEPPLCLLEARIPNGSVETRHDCARPTPWTLDEGARTAAEIRQRARVLERRRSLLAAGGVTPTAIRRAVCRRLRVPVAELARGSLDRRCVRARGIVAWLSAEYAGASHAEIARLVGVTRQGAAACIARGRELEPSFDPRGRWARFRP